MGKVLRIWGISSGVIVSAAVYQMIQDFRSREDTWTLDRRSYSVWLPKIVQYKFQAMNGRREGEDGAIKSAVQHTLETRPAAQGPSIGRYVLLE